MKKYLFVLQLTLASALSHAQQQVTLLDIIKGEKIPPTIKLSELSQDFRAIKIGSSDPAANPFAMLMPFMFLGMAMGGNSGNDESSKIFDLMALSELNWTKGETIVMSGHEYLISYRMPLSLGDLAKVSPSGSSESAALPNELKLSLIKVSSIEMLSPAPEASKERLLKLLDDLSKMQPKDAVPSSTAVAPGTIEASPDHTLGNSEVSAKQAQASSYLKQIALSIHMWLQDHTDRFPYVQSTHALRFETRMYIQDNNIWIPLNPTQSPHRFNMSLAGTSIKDVTNPAFTPMIYEGAPWADGSRIVAFVDGHTEIVSSYKWDAMQEYLNLRLKRYGKPLPMDHGSGWKPSS